MRELAKQQFEGSDRDWPEDNRYACQCFQCGKGYAGPKRSVLCYICKNKNKKVEQVVDKEIDHL